MKIDGNMLGRIAETEVECVLWDLLEKNEIMDFYRNESNGGEDSRGVDFVLYVTKHLIPIPLQVKRTPGLVKDHFKKYPHIPYVVTQCGSKPITQIRKIIASFHHQRNQTLSAHKEDIEIMKGEGKT